MGIKFQCPNGHKLNVKSFLSGKRAICPKCGARVLVPESGDASISSVGLASVELAIATEQESLAEPDHPSRAAPDHAPVAPAVSASRTSQTGADAIREAPDAMWYVRPASGGQFGPASGEIMRSWLDDGRVGGTSLVWRAGWPEWRAAASVFPQLGAAPDAGLNAVQPPPPHAVAGVPGATSGPPSLASLPQAHMVQSVAIATPTPGVSTGVPPLAQSVRRRRRANDVRLYASAVFVVLSIILLIALVVVLKRQNAAPETPSQNPPPLMEKAADQGGTLAP